MNRSASRPARLFILCSLAMWLLLAGAAAAPGATLTVTWDANTEEDLAGYKVYCGTSPGSYGQPVVVDAEATSCQLTGLESQTTYYVAVTAFDTSANESDFSAETWATTDGGGEQASYSLITGVSPAGSGTVSRSPNASSYEAGTQVTLTAAPAAGWRFDHWGGALSGSSNPATLTMNANKTVTAYFVAIPETYTLSVSTSGSGTVGRSPNASSYEAGTQVTLTATPAGWGWRFERWEGDVSTTTNPVTITMNGDKSITARFVWRWWWW